MRIFGVQLPLDSVQLVIVTAEQILVVAELMAVIGAARVHEVGCIGAAFRRVADRPRAFALRVDGDAETIAPILVFEVVARD